MSTRLALHQLSQAFFGKSASDVTLPEAAYLAALPQAPTYLSPYGNNREALENRKNLVLERMKINGFITEEEFTEAVAAEVEFEPQATLSTTLRYKLSLGPILRHIARA